MALQASETEHGEAHEWPGAGQPARPPLGPRRLVPVLATLAAASALLGAIILFAATHAANTRSTEPSAAQQRGVMDVTAVLGYRGMDAFGTGTLLTASGEVLTNNHVIEGATSVQVTDVRTGQSYAASVVGYDVTADVAVLRLQGAPHLTPAVIGDSSSLRVGQAVVGVGNAGGRGGTPSAARGSITALGQTITALDEVNGTSEQLTGAIEINAAIQSGDSGGPLLSTANKVIGIDAAASASYRLRSTGTEAFAIPINQVIAVAREVNAGRGSTAIHVGQTAFLGVAVVPAGTREGLAVTATYIGTPAEAAGLQAGDTIVSLDGEAIPSSSALTTLLSTHRPGDHVAVGWIDSFGQPHVATVQLAAGPPA